MAFNLDNIPDLDGRVAVVTGANGGLGLVTARALAGAGAHVVVPARRPEVATEAVAEIAAESPGSVEVDELDLADQDSIAA